MTMTPTAERINALEEWARDYIHRLETFTGSAGLIQENYRLREDLAAMNKMLEDAPVVDVCDGHYYVIVSHDPRVDLDEYVGKRVRLVVCDD